MNIWCLTSRNVLLKALREKLNRSHFHFSCHPHISGVHIFTLGIFCTFWIYINCQLPWQPIMKNQKNNAKRLHFWRVKGPFRRCCYMDLSKLCKHVFVMLLYITYMYFLFSSKTKQSEFWLRFGSLWKSMCDNVTEFWTKIVDWVTGYRCNIFAIQR